MLLFISTTVHIELNILSSPLNIWLLWTLQKMIKIQGYFSHYFKEVNFFLVYQVFYGFKWQGHWISQLNSIPTPQKNICRCIRLMCLIKNLLYYFPGFGKSTLMHPLPSYCNASPSYIRVLSMSQRHTAWGREALVVVSWGNPLQGPRHFLLVSFCLFHKVTLDFFSTHQFPSP